MIMTTLILIWASYIAILSLILNPIHHSVDSFTPTLNTITIAPPTSADDYRQLASLLVSSFDTPQCCTEKNGNDASSIIQRLQWDLYERSLTEEFTYKRYVSTMRRMRGKKYCLLLAKSSKETDALEGKNEICGMIEMGMSLCPINTDNNISNNNSTEMIISLTSNTTTDPTMIPTPLIGVICVAPKHQKEGIGMKLLQKSEQVATKIWNETFICADVEPDNLPALSLFEMGGYTQCLNEDGDALLRNATIMRRRRAEVKPHCLLRKRIRIVDDDNGDDIDDMSC